MPKYVLALIGGAAVIRLLRANKRTTSSKEGGFLAAMGDDHYWGPSRSHRPSRLAATLGAYQEEER